MKDYKVISPIKTENGTVKPGATVSLSDEDAAELKALGCVEDVVVASQSSVPADPAARQEAIIAAIGQLDPANADLWLGNGAPDVKAIIAVTGWNLSAAERNTAWETISTNK